MLDNLIIAYRAQIYNWNFSKYKELNTKNHKILTSLSIGVIAFMSVIAISIVLCIKLKSSVLMLIILPFELIFIVWLDQYAIRYYRKLLVNKRYHLDETVSFLKTSLSGKNLFNLEQIEELIDRLTKRIESDVPLKNFQKKIYNFTKTIVIPITAYVAGVYSGDLKQLDFATLANWAAIVVIILGFAGFAVDCIFDFLRIISGRNYNAAIALREDLMDIKLLYFTSTKNIGLVFHD